MTEFVKSGLIHASNFSTLRICNSACVRPTALKFGSRTFLSLHRNLQPNNSLINEVMQLYSGIIGCVCKTTFRKSGHKIIAKVLDHSLNFIIKLAHGSCTYKISSQSLTHNYAPLLLLSRDPQHCANFSDY